MRRWMAATGLVCAALLVPAQALAAQPKTTVVSSVSGAQIAESVAGQLKSVQVGSTGATVTLDVGGRLSPVRVDLSDLTRTIESEPGGWLTLAAIPMLGAAAIRLLSFLAKLGGH
jgi:hypothetical protein